MRVGRGRVYLVGAGPGDPDLITVRGLRVLRQADVVLFDRLVSPALVAEAPRRAERIDVGKAPGKHRYAQAWIGALLVDRARAGRTVVRLKGGDPFVFGRGFEELTACRRAGVDCYVIPGVTSAVSAPAAAGIPVTQRNVARSFAVVTAHSAGDGACPDLDFAALAAMDTVVILMGRGNLDAVTAALIRAGRPADTPAACVQSATTPDQRVVCGTLGDLAARVEAAGLTPPVTTVIGPTAAYARHAAAVAASTGGTLPSTAGEAG